MAIWDKLFRRKGVTEDVDTGDRGTDHGEHTGEQTDDLYGGSGRGEGTKTPEKTGRHETRLAGLVRKIDVSGERGEATGGDR